MWIGIIRPDYGTVDYCEYEFWLLEYFSEGLFWEQLLVMGKILNKLFCLFILGEMHDRILSKILKKKLLKSILPDSYLIN